MFYSTFGRSGQICKILRKRTSKLIRAKTVDDACSIRGPLSVGSRAIIRHVSFPHQAKTIVARHSYASAAAEYPGLKASEA